MSPRTTRPKWQTTPFGELLRAPASCRESGRVLFLGRPTSSLWRNTFSTTLRTWLQPLLLKEKRSFILMWAWYRDTEPWSYALINAEAERRIYNMYPFFFPPAGPQLLWTQAQSWISLSGVFLNSIVSFCVCWSSITRSFYDPSDLPLFANLPLLSLLSCFRFVMCLVWFGLFVFFRLAPSLLRCFALRDFVIFFAWLWRCFPWACLFAVPFDCDSSLYWPSYLLLPIAWPFQVNDASQYVIMGIDNKLNILRFGQTCPCLKP